MRARRVVWPERGRVELEEFEVGSPSEGEVLVENEFTLISPGTERAFLLALPNTPGKFPQRPGYCAVGRVLEAGPGVEGLRAGTRVVSRSPHASHAIRPAWDVIPVPENVSPEEAVFSQLLAISMHGVRAAGVELGDPVLVLGLGLVGQLALRLARLCGAVPLVGADPKPKRREAALRGGADAALDPLAGEFEAELREVCGGLPRVVIEATGLPEPVVTAFRACAPGGRVVLLGSTRGTVREVNFYELVHRKGLAVIGAHASVRPERDPCPGTKPHRFDVEASLRLLSMGRLSVRDLITHIFEAERAPEAYRLLTGDEEGRALGILLDWRGRHSRARRAR